jgi:hypothetical protein
VETKNHFETIEHDIDLCVIGGSMAGLCAAIAAARRAGLADAGPARAGRQRILRNPHVDLRGARPR